MWIACSISLTHFLQFIGMNHVVLQGKIQGVHSLVPRPSSLVGKNKGEEGLVELIM